MKALSGIVVVAAATTAFAFAARAGHEMPVYPSYYPQEIRIEPMAPAAAAEALARTRIQAYVGAMPPPAADAKSVRAVDTLGAYLVVRVNPTSPLAKDAAGRCAVAARVIGGLADDDGEVRRHPYPVTPFHADYLRHADLAAAAKSRLRSPAAVAGVLGLRVEGALAARLVKAEPATAGDEDATVEAIDLDRLLAPHRLDINGWSGPPWLKEGWFHAYLLLAEGLAAADRDRAGTLLGRLKRDDHATAEERIDLERELVGLLTADCRRVVAGYAVRRQYYTAEYANGVENIAYDSIDGFNSAIFVRTVKLKDFPWNGWLTLGVDGEPRAAWNPVGGFTDPAGRLIWHALGDPAFFPEPYGDGWSMNRIGKVETAPKPAAAATAPAGALLPEAASGRLKPVGAGGRPTAALRYGAMTSIFHDGTRTEAADLLYAYAFAYRWGVKGGDGDRRYDPEIARATALLRDRLAGIRLAGVDSASKTFRVGDTTFVREQLLVDVFLRDASADADRAQVVVAPPWSPVPWQVMALMEEAVGRGMAAFSETEARRLGVKWLDMVRDEAMTAKLKALVDRFAADGFVPEPLTGIVTAEAAKARWRALQAFGAKNGHFLVTNGPYALKTWGKDATELTVFRDMTYPLGVGSYNAYATPRRAFISAVEADARGLKVAADVETVETFGRDYRIVRRPLKDVHRTVLKGGKLDCVYLAIDGAGRVRRTGVGVLGSDGTIAIPLAGKLPPGDYRVLVTVYLNGNTVDPDIRSIPFRARAGR